VTRWEYKSYLFEIDDKVLERLNALGRDGWEAIQWRDLPDGRLRIYFKRELIEQPREPTT
jgi:hypothetical protein